MAGQDVSKRLIEFALLLPNIKVRKCDRIGVISTTVVSPDAAPPGINNFISYLARPWKKQIEAFNIQVTTTLKSENNWTDRCAHYLVRADERDNDLVTLIFDWQRIFKSEFAVSKSSLSDLTAESTKAALAYFEDVGIGSQFDEQVISNRD